MAKTIQPCPGGVEAHVAHMETNGECPWCGGYDADQTEFWSPPHGERAEQVNS